MPREELKLLTDIRDFTLPDSQTVQVVRGFCHALSPFPVGEGRERVTKTANELDRLRIRLDFTRLFYVILRRNFSEWLESSIESEAWVCDLQCGALT